MARDLEAHSHLDGEYPDTVNPGLWRQAQLHAGLFRTGDRR
jgi:alkyl sulfatase BDS1-like metallo-beta-lactamase superfamily hydrolase